MGFLLVFGVMIVFSFGYCSYSVFFIFFLFVVFNFVFIFIREGRKLVIVWNVLIKGELGGEVRNGIFSGEFV